MAIKPFITLILFIFTANTQVVTREKQVMELPGNENMTCPQDPLRLIRNITNQRGHQNANARQTRFSQLLFASLTLTYLVTVGVMLDVVLLPTQSLLPPPQQQQQQQQRCAECNTSSRAANSSESLNGSLEVNVQPTNGNLCSYFKQWTLSENINFTVCNYLSSVKMDIGAIVSDNTNIKGIWLTISEWEQLSVILELIKKEPH